VLEQARQADRAERAHGQHLRAHERVDVERVQLRRAERDDPGHEVRMPHRQHLREVPAAALADDRHPLAALLGHAREPFRQALVGRVGAVDVRAHPRLARVVPRLAQPARHQRERVVARQEARDQHHGLTGGVLHVHAAEHLAAQQRGDLQAEPAFAP
jgi:hypothetical protein